MQTENKNLRVVPGIIISGINQRLKSAISKEIMEAVIKDIILIAQPYIIDAIKKISVEGIEVGRDLLRMRDDYHVTYSTGEIK